MLTQGLSTLLNVLRGLPSTADTAASVAPVLRDTAADTGFAALFARASAASSASFSASPDPSVVQPFSAETFASSGDNAATVEPDVAGNGLPIDGELLPLNEALVDLAGVSLPEGGLSVVEDPEISSSAPLGEAADRVLEALGMPTPRPTPSTATPPPSGGSVELPLSAVAIHHPLSRDIPAGQPFNLGRSSPSSIHDAFGGTFHFQDMALTKKVGQEAVAEGVLAGRHLLSAEGLGSGSGIDLRRELAQASVARQLSGRPMPLPAPTPQANSHVQLPLNQSPSTSVQPAPAPDLVDYSPTLNLPNAMEGGVRSSESAVKTAVESQADDAVLSNLVRPDLASAEKPTPVPLQWSVPVVSDATPSARVVLTSTPMPVNLDQEITQSTPPAPVLPSSRSSSLRNSSEPSVSAQPARSVIGPVIEDSRPMGSDLFRTLVSNSANGTSPINGVISTVVPAVEEPWVKASPLTPQPENAPKPPTADGLSLEVSLEEAGGVDGEFAESARASSRADTANAPSPGSATSVSSSAALASPPVQQSPMRSGMVPQGVMAVLAEPLAHTPDSPEFPEALFGRVHMASANGLQEARLNLHPAELGRLTIHIATEGDSTRVAFTVDNPQAREALEVAMPRLRELLADSGLQLTEGSVSERQQGQGQSAARDDSRPAPVEALKTAAAPAEPAPLGTPSANPDQLLDAYA